MGGSFRGPGLRRFWLDETLGESPEDVTFEGDTLHHVKDVCRMTEGARFEVLTPDKWAYFVELIHVGKKQATAKVLERRALPELPGPRVHLYLSIPRFATFENVVEKSVELGVFAVHPFFSEFSFVRHQNKVSASRVERWKKIVKSATQQSGRGELMQVSDPVDLEEVLKNINQNSRLKGLFAYEGESPQSLVQELESWEDFESLEDVAIFVGSEGGFSSKEVELFQRHGLSPVTLGEQILRVETACVALISIIKYHLKVLG